jgi:sugar transferase (PEP-CTERM/EpsH1 system associated)
LTTEDREPRRIAETRALRILFIASRFPSPPRKGDQLRAFQQIRHLGRRHRITLVHFGAPAASDRALLQGACERIVSVPLGPVARAIGLLKGAFSALPFQVSLYRSPSMRRALHALSATPFDLTHVQLARMAPYLADGTCPRPWVVDLVDALSLGMSRRALQDRGPAALVARLEAGRLLRYERALCERADVLTVVGARDRAAIGDFPRLRLVPNAVDLAAFPFARQGRAKASVVFTGNMGYFPNRNAAAWLVREVWPRVLAENPEARLSLVGARPSADVRALGSARGVTVTGFVDDLSLHLRQAAVAVAPMRAGSGQQFKVLEAMASGTPLVATPDEALQVGARHGQDLLIADDPTAFAAAIVSLLRDASLADRLAASGRRLVESHYTWDHSVALLEEAYLQALAAASPDRLAMAEA